MQKLPTYTIKELLDKELDWYFLYNLSETVENTLFPGMHNFARKI